MVTPGPTVTASIVYDQPRQGIAWLTEILGLRLKSLYQTPGGEIAFAELVWRTGIVFVSGRPPADNPWSRTGPVSIALVAENPESVRVAFERAVSRGAEVIRACHVARTPAFPDGSTQFDLRDPAGNLWTVGTFQPTLE